MLMTQFLTRLSNLAAAKKFNSDEPLYPKEITDAILRVHEARANLWPPRPGTQFLVQFRLVEWEQALHNFAQLHEKGALSPAVASQKVDIGITELKHIEVTAVISGACIGQLTGVIMEA